MNTISRALALVTALSLAACANPKNDNVSLEGPERTTTTAERTTTTSEPTTTSTSTTTTLPPQPIEVGRWSGAADTDTENITVKESWELHWRVTDGAGISVEWIVPGESYQTDSISIDPGEAKSLIREGGTFYLHIDTFGSTYEVWAVDIPN